MKKLIIGLIILSLILIGCSSQRGTQVHIMGEKEYCFKNVYLESCEGKPSLRLSDAMSEVIRLTKESEKIRVEESIDETINTSNSSRFILGEPPDRLFRNNTFSLGTGSLYEPPDYSKEGHVKITPIANISKRFIYLECINSILVINETMLYCERREN